MSFNQRPHNFGDTRPPARLLGAAERNGTQQNPIFLADMYCRGLHLVLYSRILMRLGIVIRRWISWHYEIIIWQFIIWHRQESALAPLI